MSKSTYVLSDIHGNIKLFRNIMTQIDLQVEDTLYVLGDVIDRHPGGIHILQELMETPNVKLLRGNHEEMLIKMMLLSGEPIDWWATMMKAEARRIWYRNGGEVTHWMVNRLSIPERIEIITYLRSLPSEYRVEVNGQTYLLVHGAPKELCPEGEDPEDYTIWGCLTPDDVIPEGVTVIFGHTPTSEYQHDNPLRIWHGNRMIGIDCGSGFPDGEGRLACLRLEDKEEFYAGG